MEDYWEYICWESVKLKWKIMGMAPQAQDVWVRRMCMYVFVLCSAIYIFGLWIYTAQQHVSKVLIHINLPINVE
jgi:hypothetical protein